MKKPEICLIAAVAKNNAIGKKNGLLWHLPEDFRHFRKITMGYPIIMGQTTYRSIGKPLPGRTNIVLSRDEDLSITGTVVAHSIDEALAVAKKENAKKVFFMGGGQVYKQAMPLADKLYLTLLNKSYEADTFFPDYSEFTEEKELGRGEYKDIKYRFVELTRP